MCAGAALMARLPSGADWLRLLLILCGDLLLMRWSLSLVTPEEGISLLWLPSGFLLGCLVLLPVRLWPWLLGLTFPVVYGMELLVTDRPLTLVIVFALTNLLETLGGALLYLRWCGGREGFRTYGQLGAFLLLCVLVLPAVTAWLAAWSVVAHGLSQDLLGVYRIWHAAVGFGILFVTPLIVQGAHWLKEGGWKNHRVNRRLRLILALTLLLMASATWLSMNLDRSVPLLLSLPLLTWAAISAGLWGGVTVSALLVIAAVQLTALGLHPFGYEGLTAAESVFDLQSQLGAVVVAMFFMSLAIDKHRRLSATLAETGARFRMIFDHSPISLWEEDFSAVRAYLDARREEGVVEMASWLRAHPEAVRECARRVRILSVNSRTLELFAADAGKRGLDDLAQIFDDNSLTVFRDQLIALWEERGDFVGSAHQRALDGRALDTLVRVTLVPGHEHDWGCVLVSVEDLSERKRVQDMLDTFFEQPMTLNLITGLDGIIQRVNQCWESTLGRSRAELEGTSFLELVHPEDLEETRVELARVARGQGSDYFENRCRHRDGGYRLLAWSAAVSPTQGLIYAVASDITERRAAEERLRQTAAVFESTAEGVLITDLNGVILDVNPAFVAITGYGREEAIGQTPRILRSERQDAAFYRQMWEALQRSGQWRGELWNRRRDGSLYSELLTISLVRDGQGRARGYVGVFTDISAMKQSEERLEQLAHHDALTGLPNRLLLDVLLRRGIERAACRAQQLAVVFIDLDRFKHLNDSLGHAAGDELLCQVAERLGEAVRASDQVARLSGDEFVVLLEDIEGLEPARQAMGRLMGVFRQPFKLTQGQVYMTASMGLSFYPEDGEDAETLLRNADAAMYRAKDEGRNTYEFYTAELTAAAFENMFLENALRGALDAQQLHLVYQPQFSLQSGALSGMEVLLRWRHPEQGSISPARFIPVAEQSGLIREIGAWVLERACAQGRRWLDAGLAIGRLAVNVAGPQIQQANFADQVERILTETGLPPDCLALEVTEGFVMRRIEAAITQLERLRALGVEIAIDDFGTGYASLGYLKKLPIDKLKVDQSFIRDIPADPDDMAITEAIIVMARALGIRVIAEGVETRDQVSFLLAKGCGEAQGYFYAQPLPAQDIERTLKPGR